MAQPRTLGFGSFKVYLGDGASPEQFTAPCGFIQKALTLDSDVSDFNVPDCDDPEAAAWKSRAITAHSASVTGSGVMAMASLDEWRTWKLASESKNIRVEFDDTLANGGGYFEGAAILQSLGFSVALGSDGNKTQQQVNIVSDGEWSWVPAEA
jgi:hypothetical protein